MAGGGARLRLRCRGVVQGVGLRPFLHRLASALELGGSLCNRAGVVEIDLQGDRDRLQRFLERLQRELPAPARLESLEQCWWPLPAGTAVERQLRIAADPPVPLAIGLAAPALAADRAPCPACRSELADPANRRHGYPFISCSACGPRYSIATAEPFRREHTTLAGLPLCPACRREFEDPADRRFHAETIGCPDCGPRLTLWPPGASGADRRAAAPLLRELAALLADGAIVALQGVGGFQLLVDAGQPDAVARLRRRKRRPARPFALLVADPAWIAPHCRIDPEELAALRDPAAPIVLLRRRAGAVAPLSPTALEQLAPGCPCLGVMLPASPLHQLLLEAVGRPLVATSGNRSGEPLCTDPQEARQRLADIADAFLGHDRPIARALDDSVLQVVEGQRCLIRRARGYAPESLSLRLPDTCPEAMALGGDLKCAPALLRAGRLWLAPHLGDLAEARVEQRLVAGLAEWCQGRGQRPTLVVSDAHPGYRSHQIAAALHLPHRPVQHHLAHGLAVVAERHLQPPLLMLSCDGLGSSDPQGGDGLASLRPAHRLWGGELLLLEAGATAWQARVVGGLRPWPLPGAELAIREPRRSALGLLAAAGADALGHAGARHTLAAFTPAERSLLLQAIGSGCNSPFSSGVGRLFDAVASLLDLCQINSHEGEAALRLQGAAQGLACRPGAAGRAGRLAPLAPLQLLVAPDPLQPALLQLDWSPLLQALLAALAVPSLSAAAAERQRARLAACFHQGLAAAFAGLAQRAADRHGCRDLVLSGGCFQNRRLLELSLAACRRRRLRPHWAAAVPANDGGLAVGQLFAALFCD